jgi:hypothetical protein
MEAWTIAGVAFGSAVFGALVGGLTTLILEVWRRVLDAVSAVRLIRMELVNNVTVVAMAIDEDAVDVALSDSAWKQYRATAAPLLKQTTLGALYRELGYLPQAQADLGNLDRTIATDRTATAQSLSEWSEDLRTRAIELYEVVEKRGKAALMWTLFTRSHLSTEEELEAEFGKRPRSKQQ